MHDFARLEALDRCDWKGTHNLQYIEAFRYEGDTVADGTNFSTGSIKSEGELLQWLDNSKIPARQSPQQTIRPVGGIRLVVCDRQQYTPLKLSFSRVSFEVMEKKFGLAPMTIPSFESEAGTYSRFLSYSGKVQPKLQRIQTIIKAPQKREILNWGFSLSHDVSSGMTTGLLYGSKLENEGFERKHRSRSSIDTFVESIRASPDIWDHPMILPCLFLSEHLNCIKIFCTQGTIMMETVRIENELGVTKVGESKYLNNHGMSNRNLLSGQAQLMENHYWKPDIIDAPPSLSREDTRKLIVRINTQSTRVVFTARSPEWNLGCARFVMKTIDELERYLGDSHKVGDHECRQLLDYNIVLAEAMAHLVGSIRERMDLQLNVLYNFVAQLDNQTSAELAASASRDSTSMKILAFISALFLPGNFVSALFSMGLFDWRRGETDDAGVLSSRFWIYWAIAIPLTVATVLGWAAWWRFELADFNKRLEGLRGTKEKDAEVQARILRVPSTYRGGPPR